MKVKDNNYSLNVRDRLERECRERKWKLRSDPEHHIELIDTITYCSRGNEEEALLNLRKSMEFKNGLNNACRTLGLDWMGSVSRFEVVGDVFLFSFWRKSWFELRVALLKNENFPRESYHETIMREFGRFLNVKNFKDSEVYQEEVSTAINNFHAAYEKSNTIIDELMK